LDCFCGSGTTLKAAQELGRTWIGIDKSKEAINVSLKKLTSKQRTLTGEEEFVYLEQVSNPENIKIILDSEHPLKKENKGLEIINE
jgi:adenine-specific DNA-methyltransferase